MSEAQKLLERAWEKADPKPDIFTVSYDNWEDYFNGLTDEVREIYRREGHYIVHARKERVLGRKRKPYMPSILAFTYRGVPVVVDNQYNGLMRGHKTTRRVCRV